MPRHERTNRLTPEEELILVASVVELLSRILSFVPDTSGRRPVADEPDINAELRDTIQAAQFALARWRLVRGMQSGVITLAADSSSVEDS